MKDSTGIKSEAKNKKPVSGTEKWADWNMNFFKGCPRNCRYCYAKSMAVRFGRHTKDSWQNEIITFDDSKKYYTKYDGVGMIPSSHDITPSNLQAAIKAIGGLLKAGNELIIVSKPNLECIEALCRSIDTYKDQIRF